MARRSFFGSSIVTALAATAALSVAGCGNTPPTVDAFTISDPVVDAAGVATVRTTITVSDADGDKIVRLDLSAAGPAPIQVPSVVPPGGAVGTYQFELKIPAAAPKGEYTFSVTAFDEPGGASAVKTAKVTLK